ncbi:MAG: DUF1501 domain-containing protein, partial [Phycisphaerae bacterium]
MLSILGPKPEQFCDGHSRRKFLQIGGLALGGLSLPQILEAESTTSSAQALSDSPAAVRRPQRLNHKAIIMIYLSGGPSHQDMYD